MSALDFFFHPKRQEDLEYFREVVINHFTHTDPGLAEI